MADFTTNMSGTAELDNSAILEFDQRVLIGVGQNNVMDQFVTYAEEIGAKSIGITKYPRVAADESTLLEREAMTGTAMSDAEILFVPAEIGFHVTLTNVAMAQSGGKVLRGAVDVVARHAGEKLDRLAIAALNASTNVIFNGTAGTEAGVAVGDICNAAFMQKMYNKLQRNSVPKLAGGYYVAVLHADQVSDLQQDAGWIDVAKYANALDVLNNEMGIFKGFRVVVDNHVKVADQTGAGTVDVYRGLFFGANALGKVASQPLTTFVQPANDPGQRFWYAGYKAMLKYGIVDADAVFVGGTASSFSTTNGS